MNQQLPQHTAVSHTNVITKLWSLSMRLLSSVEVPKCQILLFSILYTLFSTPATAQQYNWDWAVSGGSPNGNESSSTGMLYNSEQIYDIKTGSDGNYYFIATMKGLNLTQLDGEPVTAYNSSLGGNDIFIFSTDCDGQVRWSQAIGGQGPLDSAYNLALDSNDNVYVGAYVTGGSTYSLHFSPDPAHDVTPFPANMDAHKRIYLVKYDSNGVFQEKKALQGTVTQANREAQISEIVIKNDTIHFIASFLNGTHLDSNVIVPSNYQYIPGNGYTMQFYLAQYDTDLNYVNSMVLPISPDSSFPFSGSTRFAYDENLNIYYLAGMRSIGINDPLTPFTYGGDPFVERSYILAFNGIGSTTGIDGGEVWRREIYSDPTPQFGYVQENRISSLVIGANSDVYVGGTFYTYDQNPLPVKVYDPSDTQVTPYIFTPGIYWNIPTVIKFSYNNSNEVSVQWAKTPTAYAANFTTPGSRHDKGLAVRGNEIAFGANTGYFVWDSFVQNPVQFHAPSPALMRFDTQTGNMVGMHTIESPADYSGFTTAVAVDNDGNYVTGGAFQAVLFTNNANVNQLVSSGGNDFFVAKLAASVCGTAVSTDKFNKLNVNVYPNPTTDIVNINTEEKIVGYFIYNEAAQKLQAKTQTTNGVQQLNLEGFAAGVYFVGLKTESGKTATVKVIKN